MPAGAQEGHGGHRFEGISVGDSYEETVLVTDEMVITFAKATGDFNPIHVDDNYARASIFKRRVVHGMLTAGLVSRVIGMEFPGQGTIYVSQTLGFRRPVFPGDEITVRLKVVEKFAEKKSVRLATECLNQANETVLVGEATVLPPLE